MPNPLFGFGAVRGCCYVSPSSNLLVFAQCDLNELAPEFSRGVLNSA